MEANSRFLQKPTSLTSTPKQLSMNQTKKKVTNSTSKTPTKKKGSAKKKTPSAKATTGSTNGAKKSCTKEGEYNEIHSFNRNTPIVKNDTPDRATTASKLDTHLTSRPNLDELKDQQIVPPNSGHVSSVLQSTQHQLQRQMHTDKVSKMLNARPDMDNLKNQGVLKGTRYIS